MGNAISCLIYGSVISMMIYISEGYDSISLLGMALNTKYSSKCIKKDYIIYLLNFTQCYIQVTQRYFHRAY